MKLLRKNLGAFFWARPKKPGFPLQVLGFANANPVGFPLQSLAQRQRQSHTRIRACATSRRANARRLPETMRNFASRNCAQSRPFAAGQLIFGGLYAEHT
jgi:hypothetical protein